MPAGTRKPSGGPADRAPDGLDLGRAAWLAALFSGEEDDAGWLVMPCPTSRLAEAICGALRPGSFEEVLALVCPGESEEGVGERQWESLRLGYARYTRDMRARGRAKRREGERQ